MVKANHALSNSALVVKIMSLTRLKRESYSPRPMLKYVQLVPGRLAYEEAVCLRRGSREVTRERQAKGEIISCCTYLLHTFFSFDLKWNSITITCLVWKNNTGVVSFIRMISVEDCKLHMNFRCSSIIWVGIFFGIIVVVSWSINLCRIEFPINPSKWIALYLITKTRKGYIFANFHSILCFLCSHCGFKASWV